MTFKNINKSYLTAGLIAVAIVLWLLSGQLGKEAPDSASSASQSSATTGNQVGQHAVSVQGMRTKSVPYTSEVIIRGRTQALRSVELKAQTDGRIVGLPVEKGARVKAGQVICELAVDDRTARLDEANALARQRELEYRAAVELEKKGHMSANQAAGAKANLDAASAQVTQMKVELEYTKIKAPFDSILDQRPAEMGDYLQKGDMCAVVVDVDPFLVVGSVSERDVNQLSVGDHGTARLANGQTVEGNIRFISNTAQTETRTFRIELEVANPAGRIRDGITAEASIPVSKVEAHLIPPATLVLSDSGEMGVRISENGIAKFYPVTIIGDDKRGIWVKGIPDNSMLITVGQDFVIDGQSVSVHEANQEPVS